MLHKGNKCCVFNLCQEFDPSCYPEYRAWKKSYEGVHYYMFMTPGTRVIPGLVVMIGLIWFAFLVPHQMYSPGRLRGIKI